MTKNEIAAYNAGYKKGLKHGFTDGYTAGREDGVELYLKHRTESIHLALQILPPRITPPDTGDQE